MESTGFLFSTLSLLTLLLISSFVYLLSKKIKTPYTVLLVLFWLLLVPLSKFSFFWFIDDFKLTPDVLFFVFLPILLFEASYNINYKYILKDWKAIWWLSIFWLIISAFVISVLLYFTFSLAWFHIPFLVLLLFWSLISATDPVAVLAIFKSMWAPRRLALIFEWESLFNDWTALVLFLVVLWIILEGTHISPMMFVWWLWTFASMLIWWVVFWLFVWALFSKTLWYIKNNEQSEITITMISAHITFLSSELITHFYPFIPISWVIATVVSWMVIWNYWKYKITARVEAHMNKFWEFFAFLANSVVFILMWLTLSSVDIDFPYFIWPIIITIIVVSIARSVSVYGVLWFINFFSKDKCQNVPLNWQHLLSWWSLRWALALMMVLLVPWEWDPWYDKILMFEHAVNWSYPFSIKDFLLVLTIWSIMFTLFIKATTISYFMKKMKIDKLHDIEELEYEEWKILANIKILEKLDSLHRKIYLTNIEYEELKRKYEARLKLAVSNIKNILNQDQDNVLKLVNRLISLHALWIEKQYLKDLFLYNEIDERNFKYILRKIEKQMDRIECWYSQIRKISWQKSDYDFFVSMFFKFYKNFDNPVNVYIRNRARAVITSKVIKELRQLSEIDFWFWDEVFQDTIELYSSFNRTAEEKKNMIALDMRATIMWLESRLVEKSLIRLEESVLKDLYSKEIITPKLYIKFMEEVERQIYTDFRVMD